MYKDSTNLILTNALNICFANMSRKTSRALNGKHLCPECIIYFSIVLTCWRSVAFCFPFVVAQHTQHTHPHGVTRAAWGSRRRKTSSSACLHHHHHHHYYYRFTALLYKSFQCTAPHTLWTAFTLCPSFAVAHNCFFTSVVYSSS